MICLTADEVHTETLSIHRVLMRTMTDIVYSSPESNMMRMMTRNLSGFSEMVYTRARNFQSFQMFRLYVVYGRKLKVVVVPVAIYISGLSTISISPRTHSRLKEVYSRTQQHAPSQ